MPQTQNKAVRGDMKYIIEEQTKNAVSKFLILTEILNVDCFEDYALKLCVIVCSRYKMEQKGTLLQICSPLLIKQVELIDESAMENMACNENFVSTNFDWTFFINKLEFDADKDIKQLEENAVLNRITHTINETMLPHCEMNGLHFACRVLLFSSIVNTPASRMVENFVNDLCAQTEYPVPHDLEVRVMRTLASIHDSQTSSKEILETIIQILGCMCVSKSMFEMIRFVISARSLQRNDEIRYRCKGRPSLADKVKQLTLQEKTNVKYDMSFAEWQAAQRFATTMSPRMQRLLYFMRVQVETMPLEVYLNYFEEPIARRAVSSVIGHIEARTIIELLQLIRCYSHNIKVLIDFRTTVLLGLPQSVRQKLNMAQVLQLYISCYQHASIREECFREFANSYNYSIRNNCDIFRAKNAFELDAVLKTLHQSIFD